MKDQAIITHVARGCVDDGPGLRTVIYTKGCTLHCAWCHNPQTISPKPQVMHFTHSCIGCGACLRLCPDCFTRQGSSVRIEPAACKGCGKCKRQCPMEAIDGQIRMPHTIDTTKCIKCGACWGSCPFGAIREE